ncbi:MAG: hypothetical protein V2A53_07375 [bacterium]
MKKKIRVRVGGGYIASVKTSKKEILQDLEKFTRVKYIDIDNDGEKEILIRFGIAMDMKEEIVRVIDKVEGRYKEIINLDECLYKGDAYVNTIKSKKRKGKELIIKVIQYNSSEEEKVDIYGFNENNLINLISFSKQDGLDYLKEAKISFSFDKKTGWLRMNIKWDKIYTRLYKKTIEKWDEEYAYNGYQFLKERESEHNTYDAGDLIKLQIKDNPRLNFKKAVKEIINIGLICEERIWQGDIDNDGENEMVIDPGDYLLLLYKDDKGYAKWKEFDAIWMSEVAQDKDLNNDGIKELLIITCGGNGAGGSFAYLIGKVGDEFEITFQTENSSCDGTYLKDLDNDGIEEIISNACLVYNQLYCPVVYKWNGKIYIDASLQFPKFFKEQAEIMEKNPTEDPLWKAIDLYCIGRYKRMFGIDKEAGFEEAVNWINGSDEILYKYAIFTFGEIGNEASKNELLKLKNGKLQTQGELEQLVNDALESMEKK